MSSVTFKQLRAFVVLAHEHSFVRAAERLHITPPTLTASIKSLEEALELRLFDRSTRNVVPTAHATSFLPVAERLLDDLDRALEELHDKAGLRSGSVVVAGATSFINYVMSPAVARLAVEHPGIRVRLIEAATAGVRRCVLDGEADFGVTTLHEPDPSLDATRLLSDRIGVVCSRAHPIAALPGPVTLADVARYPCVGLSRINGVQVLIESDRRVPDCCRRPAYEVSDFPLMEPLLERGVGIALLPAMAARVITRSQLVYKPLRVAIQRHIYFIVPRGRSLAPAARAFANLMLAELHAMPADPAVSVVRSLNGLTAMPIDRTFPR